jgi:chaperonin GroES
MTKATNNSGIHPSEFNVLVRPKPVEEKTKGGIILPDNTKEREQFAQLEGVLIEASPLAFTYHDGTVEAFNPPKAGDRILFAKYAGALVTGSDGVDYRIIKDKDLTAVLS